LALLRPSLALALVLVSTSDAAAQQRSFQALTLAADGWVSRGDTLVSSGSRLRYDQGSGAIRIQFLHVGATHGFHLDTRLGWSMGSSSGGVSLNNGRLWVLGVLPLVHRERVLLGLEAGGGIEGGDAWTPRTLLRFYPALGLLAQVRLGEDTWLMGQFRPAPVSLMTMVNTEDQAPRTLREWPATLGLHVHGFFLALDMNHVTMTGVGAGRRASRQDLGLSLGYRRIFGP
jgi:hypothetical protein